MKHYKKCVKLVSKLIPDQVLYYGIKATLPTDDYRFGDNYTLLDMILEDKQTNTITLTTNVWQYYPNGPIQANYHIEDLSEKDWIELYKKAR